MRLLTLSVVAGCTFLIGAYAGSTWYTRSQTMPLITKAVARIYPTRGNVVEGVVTFTQETDGMHVYAVCSGLQPGKHGFHIHESGDCSCSDGECAGGHFNPTNMPHGDRTSAQRHAGDLGNIEADASGKAVYMFIDKELKLNGPTSIIGRSVIVHAQEDDLVSQPTGDAGARIGCGTIGIAQ